MIKILNEEKAKNVWNNTILPLLNCTYYQSYEYAMVYKKQDKVEFIYLDDANKKICGFVKIEDDILKMPFGPIVSNNVSTSDVINFIKEISDYYDKNILFLLSNSLISEMNDINIKKDWLFVTPIIDTTLSIDTIIKNSTENRRRIIRKGLKAIPSENIKCGIRYLDEFCNLYEKRMRETNGEVDFTYDILEGYLKQVNSNLVVCLDKNKVIAGHMIFSFGDTLITRYNCFDSEYSKISPSARIEFELIKNACENVNIKNYDMSGLAVGDEISPKSMGINRYKESYNPTKRYVYQWYKYERNK